MKRRKIISEQAITLLARLDVMKAESGLKHDEMLGTVAAAMASMPRQDRVTFRRLFDATEREMHPGEHAEARLS